MQFISKTLNLDPKQSQRYTQLGKSLDAFCIAQLTESIDSPLVIIVSDMTEARRMKKELAVFRQDDYPIASFDDWETLPYDLFSPHQDIISNRLLSLYQLPKMTSGIMIIPVSTLIQKLAPPSFLEQHSLVMQVGDIVDLIEMRERLVKAGYYAVDQVMEHGEFALRGSILDLFPMGSSSPFRIDFFDNEIDSIKLFDTETQRSSETIQNIQLLPAKEFPINDTGIGRFRKNWRANFDTQNKDSLYQRVSKGEFPAGIEYYLPYFHEHLVCFLDYLPQGSCVIFDQQLDNRMKLEWQEINERYEQRRHDTGRPILAPEELFYKQEEIFQRLKQHQRIEFRDNAREKLIKATACVDITVEHRHSQPLEKLVNWQSQQQLKVIICADSAGRRESIITLFAENNISITSTDDWHTALNKQHDFQVIIGHLDSGFVLDEHNIAVLGENLLFGFQQTQQQVKQESSIDADAIIRNLAELKISDAVVHSEHGIGRYLGLETIATDGMEAEYLCLEYSGGDKLYVPVQMLHLIGRYTGANEDSIPLHRLGSEQWTKAKQKAAAKARDVAAELLDIHARRAAKPGVSWSVPAQDYAKFCADFSFQTTTDQQQAIDAVLTDLQANKPMDRLVCGDVGFGKTEVALRAAFVVTQNLKQVAVLVPTTLLAQQHYESFTDRFANWPINIEMLSRFKTAKQQKQILQQLEDGKIDILIGTHKLLSEKINFASLGLVIIDEEHRFGVTQKEKIKRFRADVDILTLTATPIPRTLNMSFAGIRDLSIIASPPARRLAIKTFVREHNKPLIREAIMREIHRGGQVYFLHNDVASINKTAKMLEQLVPEARVGVGHGQMREKELEHLMQDFYHQRFNVLVCTTIIETGIDVPTANTIIMERADKFGLAQLHQLRGRVGRSHHQAYAFLLTPHPRQLTKDAVKRLEAISTYTDLGAGFVLATQDMEIRGAGELLGDEQSGQIQSIGFSLYMELLESAVNALKEGKEPSLQQSLSNKTEIDLSCSALIPDDFIADVGLRLSFYKRIANAKTKQSLDNLQVELIDRFGLLPDACKNLFAISELKLLTSGYGMTKLRYGDTSGAIEFKQDAPVEPMSIIELMQSGLYQCRMKGATDLVFEYEVNSVPEKIKVIESICDKLKIRIDS